MTPTLAWAPARTMSDSSTNRADANNGLWLEIGEGRLRIMDMGQGQNRTLTKAVILESLILNYFGLTSGDAFGKDSRKTYI